MAIRVGINGFGRIGRLVYRATRTKYKGRIQVMAVNDVGDPLVMTHLLKYDTNYGGFPGEVRRTAEGFVPELKGKFTAMAFRVPTSTVSVVDFTAVLSRAASREVGKRVACRGASHCLP